MKLIIQIPCFNEEATIAQTLADLPRRVPGVDAVEWLVIDDGSTDRTVEIARAHGVDHVVRLRRNMGLAKAFMTGLDACLRLGADIIVNTDGDNQYCGRDIPALVAPIADGSADMVVGQRPILDTPHFSNAKKRLQRLGSWVVRTISRTEVPDAPSGFRAIGRTTALRLHLFNSYTYTLETIIQAGLEGMRVVSVPVRTNAKTRDSRLIKSIPTYIARSVMTMARAFVIYKPGWFFFSLGAPPFVVGIALFLRWLWLYVLQDGRSHVPSLVAASSLLTLAFLLWALGVLGEILAAQRRLILDNLARLRELEYRGQAEQRPRGPA